MALGRLQLPERRRLLSLVLVLVLGIVGVSAISRLPKVETPAATPVANKWLSTDGIARAVALRKSLGLRADDAWIRLVATNPSALANVDRYSIPVLDSEVTHVADREAILADLEQFRAGHVDAWGGYYLDGNVIVVMLIDPTGALEQELRTTIPSQLFVRQARWSFQELTDLSVRISEDPWLQEHYHLLSAGADVEHNNVALEVSSADSSAPAEIARHFNLGAELTVTIDGTGGGSSNPPRG